MFKPPISARDYQQNANIRQRGWNNGRVLNSINFACQFCLSAFQRPYQVLVRTDRKGEKQEGVADTIYIYI